MKKILLWLVCLILVASSVSAQVTTYRRRFRVPVSGQIQTPPPPPTDPRTCTITSPTANPNFSTTDTTIQLTGVCTPQYTHGTWASNVGGRSGSLVFTQTGAWELAPSAGTATVFDDRMDSLSSVNANTHTAVVGQNPSWEITYTSSGINYCRILSNDIMIPALTENNGARLLCKLLPNPSLGSSTTWEFALQLNNTPSFVWNPNVNGQNVDLLFGIGSSTSQDNLCGVSIYAAAHASYDIKGFKRVAGVATSLLSLDINPAAGDLISVGRSGDTYTVYRNEVSVGSFTDSACSATNTLGIGFGGFFDATEDITTTSYIDNVLVTNLSGGTIGAGLSAGNQTITITACDASAVCDGIDSIIVSQGAGADVTPPSSLVITTPVGDPNPYAMTTATPVISGNAADSVGIDHVSFICNNSCSPLSGRANGNNSWTLPTITFASGDTTLTIQAFDAAGNHLDITRTYRFNPTDFTIPTISITSTCGTVTSTPQVITGTSADNSGSIQSITCTNTTSGVVATASGFPAASPQNWNVSMALTGNSNSLSCVSRDASGNASTPATCSVTYNVPLSINTQTLANGTKGSSYTASIVGMGGAAPYSYTNNGAGTSLNDSDLQCAGLSIAANGNITGNPSAAGLCSWVGKVTDNVSATATKSLSITIIDPSATLGGQDHTLYDAAVASPYIWRCESFRNPITLAKAAAGPTSGCASAGLLWGVNNLHYATYDPSNDTDPQKQDAAKLVNYAWLPNSYVGGAARTVVTEINDTDATLTLNIAIPSSGTVGMGIKFADTGEIVVCKNPCKVTGSTTNTYNILRGAFGTTPARHLVGEEVYLSSNKFSVQKMQVFTGMTDGTAKWLFSWDVLDTDSMLRWSTAGRSDGVFGNAVLAPSAMTHIKGFRFLKPGDELWLELDWATNGGVNQPGYSCCVASNWVKDATIGTDLTHVANEGNDHWEFSIFGPLSLGGGPNGPVVPQVNQFPAWHAGKWRRYWFYLEQYKESSAADLTDVFTSLTNGIDSSTLSLTLNSPTSDFPFCSTTCNQFTNGTGTYQGRYILIDSEVIELNECGPPYTGTTRTCSILHRNALGTSAGSHLANATVYSKYDRVTLYMADEENAPVKIYDRFPVLLGTNKNNGGSTVNTVAKFEVTLDSSLSSIGQKRVDDGFTPVYMYIKDFFMLKNPGDNWTDTWLVQPTVRGN